MKRVMVNCFMRTPMRPWLLLCLITLLAIARGMRELLISAWLSMAASGGRHHLCGQGISLPNQWNV